MSNVNQFPVSGCVGLWFAHDYVPGLAPAIPNAMAGSPASQNLLIAPRRMFNDLTFWQRHTPTCTVTDAYSSAPPGWEESSRHQGNGGWSQEQTRPGLAAGTYTVGLDVKSNTGSNQTFNVAGGNGSNYQYTTLTATVAGGRQAFTFTHPGGNCTITLYGASPSATNDLLFRDVELFSGSADLHQPLVGHIYLKGPAASFGGGLLDMSGGAYGFCQLGGALAVDQPFTIQAAVKSLAPGQGQNPIFTKVQAYGDFAFQTSQLFNYSGEVPRTAQNAQFNRLGASQSNIFDGTLRLIDSKSLNLLTLRYDGMATEFWVNDTMFYRHEVPMAAGKTISDLYFNILNATNAYSGQGYLGMGLWATALSDAHIRDTFTSWKAVAARHGGTPLGKATQTALFFEGDSRSIAWSYTCPFQYFRQRTNPVFGNNWATSGYDVLGLTDRGAIIDRCLPADMTGRNFVLIVDMIGANDIGRICLDAADAAEVADTFLSRLAAYCAARKAAGWSKIAVPTQLQADWGAHQAMGDAARALVNAELRSSWVGTHCDAIVDYAADSIMGIDGSSAAHPTYWHEASMATHLSQAGHNRLLPILKAVADTLLGSS